MISQIRKQYEKFADVYIGKTIGKTGINPNTITILSLPIAFAAAYLIATQQWLAALLVMLFSIVIDNIDGAVARAQKRTTKWGSYLDYICDKIVELTLLTGFAFAGYPILAIIAACLNMLNSVAKPAAAIRIPLGNADWPAIGERADRLIVMLAGVFVVLFTPNIMGYDTIAIMLVLFSLLNLIGFMQRVTFAKKLILSHEKTGKKQMVRP